MSKVEKLQELLGQFCAGGYSNGFVGEANARWVADNYDFVVVSDVYRVGYMACLLSGVDEDTHGIDELIEILEGLEDYPLIDDQYLSDLIMADEERVVAEYAREWDIPAEYIYRAIEELDAQMEWEQDYAYLPNCYVEDVHAKALELGQTWEAHYNSGVSHTPEVCGYCKDAEVA
jgi:hypothetical protein